MTNTMGLNQEEFDNFDLDKMIKDSCGPIEPYVNPLDLTLNDFIDSQTFYLEVGLKEEHAELINLTYIQGRISGLMSGWAVHNKTGVTGDFNKYTKARKIYESLIVQDDDFDGEYE